jgi:hypothetical protein
VATAIPEIAALAQLRPQGGMAYIQRFAFPASRSSTALFAKSASTRQSLDKL